MEAKVFIASPGGLELERREFHDTLVSVSEELERMGITPVRFKPIGWELVTPTAQRPQSAINRRVTKCDFFVMLLHSRWGSATSPGSDPQYSSGSEEEFNVAQAAMMDGNLPMRDMAVYFKSIDPAQLADPGPQLAKVLEFKRELEAGKSFLYATFDEPGAFRKQLRDLLFDWVRAIAESRRAAILEPSFTAVDRDRDSQQSSSGSSVAKLIDKAWSLANDGRLVEAETTFSVALIERGDSTRPISEFGRFLHRVGRLSQAEAMYKKALTINESLGHKKDMAANYSKLGIIYYVRGDLDDAKEIFQKALTINELLDHKEGMAANYRSLGNVYLVRDDLESSEAMYLKALAADESLGHKEGMAADYGNLGSLYQVRDDLDGAEVMHQKSLVIEESLGHKEGMATDYSNLGNVYEARGDLDGAEAMYQKALVINESLGHKQGMATNYGNLGKVYETRGAMDGAETMYQKALAINESLGRKQGIATNHCNLGIVYKAHGNLDEARSAWEESLALYKQLHNDGMVKKIQDFIRNLP